MSLSGCRDHVLTLELRTSLCFVHRELTRQPIFVVVARPARSRSSVLRELTGRVIIVAVQATVPPPARSIGGSVLSSLRVQRCGFRRKGRDGFGVTIVHTKCFCFHLLASTYFRATVWYGDHSRRQELAKEHNFDIFALFVLQGD